MPDTERQESLSERVVKEAVNRGMESEMRDSILEAVEESEGPARRRRRLPIVGGLLGIGAAFGYLLGTQSRGTGEDGGQGSVLERFDESEVVDKLEGVELVEEAEEVGEGIEETTTGEAESGRRRLPRIVLGLGALAGAAVLRRRLQSGEEEEWEPIEEFTTATESEEEEEAEAEEGGETEEADEAETDEEEAGDEAEAEETEE